MTDLRAAVRSLFKSPGFSAVAIVTMAVGIGANAALFSIYDRLVLHPVTIQDSSTLVAILSQGPQFPGAIPAVAWPRYQELSAHVTSFESIGVSAFDSFALTGNGDPEQLTGLRASASFLPTLGVRPALGRNFTTEEDAPNGAAVCIISDELWQTRFGGRAGLVGETIVLNGRPSQVVGITPPRLSVPFSQVQVLVPRVFETSGLTPAQVQIGATFTQPIARLKPQATLAQAVSELESLSRRYKEAFGGRLDAGNTMMAQTYVASLVGGLEPTFYTLLGAVAFVLLIACANVSSLFLGRLAAREKEIAIRLSLGASRVRVIRQFLCESVVFSAIAGVLGVALAMWALTALQTLLSSQLPPNTAVTVNWRAVWFTGAVTCGCAVLVALVPGLQASKPQLVAALKDSARGSSSARAGRFRSALMIAEVALAVVLLVGSGLLLLSFLKLQRAEPGFDPGGVAAAFVNLPAARYGTPAQRTDFYDRVIARLRADPKISGAGVALSLPLSGGSPRAPYTVGGQQVLPISQRPLAGLMIASDDFFRLMRIPFVEGRTFGPGDRTGGPGVCIINASLARRLFPGQSALGHVLLRGANGEVSSEIVGVIHDVKTLGLNTPVQDEIYYSHRQLSRPGLSIVARTSGDPAALQSLIRSAVLDVDKDQPISFFSTLDNTVAQSLGTQRIVASLTVVFAALALVLSAVGLYSVLAYAVSQRTAEIGIRMALGARRGQVVGMVMGGGLRLVAIGLAAGLAGAAAASRLIRTLLFDVPLLDPLTYGAVILLFAIVGALACLIPSLRASRIDPLLALRGE
jgi:predicted permease